MKLKRRYRMPGGIDYAELKVYAKRRREVLEAAGCSTYVLGERMGAQGIVCLCCGLGSSHADDIVSRYCGFCAEFHSEWKVGLKTS
jgi:hypothetical protein